MAIYDLSSKEFAKELKKTRALMDKAPSVYGEPTMTLEELRRRMDEELPPGFSLSEFLIKEREASW